MKIHNHSEKSNGEIPKSLICFFLTAQLFGIDLGFTMILKKFQCFVKYLTFFLAVTFLIILLAPSFNLYKEIWFWLNFMEYLAYLIALNITKYKAYDFIIDVNKIHGIKIVEQKILTGIAIVYTSATITMQVVFVTAYAVSNKNVFEEQFYSVYYYFIYCIPCLSLDFIAITKLIVIYYVYCCVKDLKQRFVSSRISLEKVAEQYTDIADVYDRMRPFYDVIVSIS